MLAFKLNERACFVYGFPKNARSNIDDNEARALKALAKEYLGYDAKAIRMVIKSNELREVRCDDEQEKD